MGEPNDFKIFSLDDIEDVKDVQYLTIPVPEWDKDGVKAAVRVGSIDAGEMIAWLEANEGPAKNTSGLRILVKSLVDEKGARIGNDKALAMLKKKNSVVITRIIWEILYMNGIRQRPPKDAAEAVKQKEDSPKNESGEALTDASPTV